MNFCMTEYLSEGVFGVVVCDNRSASGSGGAGGRSCGNPEEFFWGGGTHAQRCRTEVTNVESLATQASDDHRSRQLRTPVSGLTLCPMFHSQSAFPHLSLAHGRGSCTLLGDLAKKRTFWDPSVWRAQRCRQIHSKPENRFQPNDRCCRTVTYHLAVWKRSKGSKSRDPATIDAIFPKCCLDHHTGMAQRICWTLFSYRMWCCNPLLFATWDTMGLFLPGHQKAAFLRSISRGCRMIHWKASCFSVALMNEESLVNGTGVLRQLTS